MSELSHTHRAFLMLRLVPDMSRSRMLRLLDHFEGPEQVLGGTAAEISQLRGFDPDFVRRLLDAPNTVNVDAELELMARHKTKLITMDDADYPEHLRQIPLPPPLLFVRGTLHADDRCSVAMVGSRQTTTYGRTVAEQFAARLAACGLTIVSGFARGIDTAAHEAALKVNGRTVAILGNGLKVCYPAENHSLMHRIAENGALISEYPMQTTPERHNFPERNQIIAGFSLGTLVVEAAMKSGALITATHALEYNRFLFAVPGDVTRLNSRGSNALIQSGAKLVQTPQDVLMEMKDVLRGYLKDDAKIFDSTHSEDTDAQMLSRDPYESVSSSASAQKVSTPRQKSVLSEAERAVVELLQHEPLHFDDILAKLDATLVPSAKLPTILLTLELKQIVRQMPGKLYTAAI
jgi:DNA processing protein